MKRPREIVSLDNIDERFGKEYIFAEHERYIKQAMEDEKVARQIMKKEAKEAGALVECGCCYDEFMTDEMAQCEDGHLFCLECCKKAANEIIGRTGTKFPCLDSSGCKFEFTLQEIKKFLPAIVFEKHVQRIQEEEIRQAQIPDLVTCPYCPYSVIITNKDDKVFKCNSCKKESCILCKEESHIPFRCNEIEKKSEVALRTFIENKMTEALLRKCWKCKKSFYKTEGCNHMTCSCGAEQCYVCQKPLHRPWADHFGTNKGQCPPSSNNDELNKKNAIEGGRTALNEYILENPELAEIELKYNPLEEAKNKTSEPAKKKKKTI